MAGDRVGCFDHAGIGVTEQVGYLGRRKISFFQLSAEGGAPVVVVIFSVDSQRFEGPR
jgi:hypothetical protein